MSKETDKLINEIKLMALNSVKDLVGSILKGAKVFFVYILPSSIVAVLVSPELQDVINSNPSLAVYAPLFNVTLVMIANLIKSKLPEEHLIKKAL